jgi:hypothetical protein
MVQIDSIFFPATSWKLFATVHVTKMMTPQVIFFIVIQSGLTAVLSAAVVVIQRATINLQTILKIKNSFSFHFLKTLLYSQDEYGSFIRFRFRHEWILEILEKKTRKNYNHWMDLVPVTHFIFFSNVNEMIFACTS